MRKLPTARPNRPEPKGANGSLIAKKPRMVRVSQAVHSHIIRKSRKYETMDAALRRLLGVKP